MTLADVDHAHCGVIWTNADQFDSADHRLGRLIFSASQYLSQLGPARLTILAKFGPLLAWYGQQLGRLRARSVKYLR